MQREKKSALIQAILSQDIEGVSRIVRSRVGLKELATPDPQSKLFPVTYAVKESVYGNYYYSDFDETPGGTVSKSSKIALIIIRAIKSNSANLERQHRFSLKRINDQVIKNYSVYHHYTVLQLLHKNGINIRTKFSTSPTSGDREFYTVPWNQSLDRLKTYIPFMSSCGLYTINDFKTFMDLYGGLPDVVHGCFDETHIITDESLASKIVVEITDIISNCITFYSDDVYETSEHEKTNALNRMKHLPRTALTMKDLEVALKNFVNPVEGTILHTMPTRVNKTAEIIYEFFANYFLVLPPMNVRMFELAKETPGYAVFFAKKRLAYAWALKKAGDLEYREIENETQRTFWHLGRLSFDPWLVIMSFVIPEMKRLIVRHPSF